jgi:hypothetical protein
MEKTCPHPPRLRMDCPFSRCVEAKNLFLFLFFVIYICHLPSNLLFFPKRYRDLWEFWSDRYLLSLFLSQTAVFRFWERFFGVSAVDNFCQVWNLMGFVSWCITIIKWCWHFFKIRFVLNWFSNKCGPRHSSIYNLQFYTLIK